MVLSIVFIYLTHFKQIYRLIFSIFYEFTPNPASQRQTHLADKAQTGGDYQEIGSLYGFQLLVKTEMSEKDGVDIRVNRFLIQGEGNIKYTYNNGILAKDEKLAAINFLNALEKLPGYIEQEQKKIKEIQKDLPVLQEVINGTWSKENRLSELKTQLAAVERKIQLSITPETKDQPAEQVEKQKENTIRLPRRIL